MIKKLALSVMLACLLSTPAKAFLTPKLLAKFTYGHNFIGETAKSYKLGGGLAFELEFIDYLSGGIFIHASSANIFNVKVQSSSANKSADLKAALIDAGLYLKPQIPIELEALTLTPYISFGVGIPSFSIIQSGSTNSSVLSQFYSCLIGLDLTIAEHWILLAEAGVATNIRLSTPEFLLIPFSVNAGIGYRF